MCKRGCSIIVRLFLLYFTGGCHQQFDYSLANTSTNELSTHQSFTAKGNTKYATLLSFFQTFQLTGFTWRYGPGYIYRLRRLPRSRLQHNFCQFSQATYYYLLTCLCREFSPGCCMHDWVCPFPCSVWHRRQMRTEFSGTYASVGNCRHSPGNAHT